jgi:16S rRNA C1402 N4-methylase RsmH
MPAADEIERNPRARSAVLRIAEKIPSETLPSGGSS